MPPLTWVSLVFLAIVTIDEAVEDESICIGLLAGGRGGGRGSRPA